jgi:branched-chain amino acid transport system ATP-binding protein
MSSTRPAEDLLTAHGLTHRYGGILALDDVSLNIPRGSFLSIFGANGAGKSTLGLILSGLLQPGSGTISFAEGDAKRRRRSVRLVPEGRRLFGQLSVAENLLLGGYGAGIPLREIRKRMEKILADLPKALRTNPDRAAAMLSGGEQQMLAIGRALMANPELLIIDEPSMGLAPILTKQIYTELTRLNRDGLTVVLLEQMPTHAITHSSAVLVLDRGRSVFSGAADMTATNAALLKAYVGRETGTG